MSAVLLDTDVVIDSLRGRTQAIELFESLIDRPMIATISVVELYSGVREGAERATLERLLNGLEIIDLTDAIVVRGGLLRRQFGKSHGVGIADAVIAATAEDADATLLSLNLKHFPMLSKAASPYQKQ